MAKALEDMSRKELEAEIIEDSRKSFTVDGYCGKDQMERVTEEVRSYDMVTLVKEVWQIRGR